MKTYSVQFGAGDPRQFTGLSPTLLIFVNIASGATLVAPSFAEALTGSGLYKFQYGTTTPISFLADAATTSPGTQGRYVAGQIDPSDRSDEYGTTLVAIGSTLFGQGVTNIALGTTSVAIGTTLTGYGVTLQALGTTIFGQGVTNIALGTSNVALGTSNIALGVSNLAQGLTALGYGVTNFGFGVSGFAQGSTLFGYGVSIYAQVQAMGNTLTAIGNTVSVGGISFGALLDLIGSTASSFGDQTTDPATLFGYLKRVQENLEGDSNYVKVSGIWTILDRSGATTLIVKTIANNATLVAKS